MVVKKHRLLLVEVVFGRAPTPGSLSEDELLQALRDALLMNWGDLCASEAQLKIMYWSPLLHLGIIRCTRPSAERLRLVMTLVSEVGGRTAQLRVHHFGATLRSCQAHGADLIHGRKQRSVALASTPAERCDIEQAFDNEAGLLAQVGKVGYS